MRGYVFTDEERRRLLRWLAAGEEDDATRMTFVAIRRNIPRLRRDLKLTLMVIRELRRRRRWERRMRLPKDVGQMRGALEAKIQSLKAREKA